MKRYSKSYSNYILRKRHQAVEGGTIFERDWGTLGERHAIEPGKKTVYSDSNFLFTDNIRPGNRYKTNTGEWSEPYTQESLGDKVDTTVNDTTILGNSNDIRDYAYYGSAVELVRSTIENIVKWFPGRFWATNDVVNRLSESGEDMLYIKDIINDSHHNYAIEYTTDREECRLHIIDNPFTIDFYNTNSVFGKYDNTLRNMPFSFKQYKLNGNSIKSWDVWIRPFGCVESYTIKYDITFSYEEQSVIKTGHLYGITYNNTIVWCTTVDNMVVQPEDSVIDNYFKGLDGFEAKLLDRQYNPIYTTKLITPIPYVNNIPDYMYAERVYSWPHDGYCIEVDTIPFESYVNSLYGLAATMDELWCNNIWRSMTHEAITNFDWSYTRQYEVGQEEEGILGGTRMEGILKIWGRFYDDIKRYVDSIDLKNCITYDDKQQNLGNAELSDKASLLGWEIYSTKTNDDDNLYLTQDFLDNYVDKLDQNERWGYYDKYRAGEIIDSGTVYYVYNETEHKYEPGQGLVLPYIVQEDDHYYKYVDATVSYEKWYNTRNVDQISQNMVDNDFMKRLTLSTGEIFRTKGTKQAIEMVFGMFGIGNHDEANPDFEFKEKYYSVVPKKCDDMFYYYEIQHPLEVIAEDYTTPAGEYESLDEYLEINPATEDSIPKLELNGDYYDLNSMTVREFCDYLMAEKLYVANYDDEFSGVPIKEVVINGEHYIIPYLTNDRIYDGNVFFESKGGWGKSVIPGYDYDIAATQEYDYLETIPYMDIVQNVGSLMTVNGYQIGNKKIFYVVNLADLSDYIETIPDNISHLFKLNDIELINQFSAWKNIPSDGYINPSYDIFDGVTDEDIKLAEYCNSLIFDNLGNNPHCGYSDYDLGKEYLEYIKLPFKCSIEKYGFSLNSDAVSASQFKFDVTEHSGEKIVNLIGNTELEYILPSKMLTITNNVHNIHYKDYLDKVVMKYVLQVIPSTTILVLEDDTYNNVGYFYLSDYQVPQSLSINDMNFSEDNHITINSMADFTIMAVPEFKSVTLKYTSDGITSIVTECNQQPCLVHIPDRYVSELPEGYKVLQYYFGGINNIDSAEIIIQ